ncbi:MAG: bifunctional serine/threonine-protein kinase/formylglycine-generating enzyme family protein [Candidatus Sumerlaeota bacterium]|nr:bifunctional serine/threonine-protein kinase/formylglycine-generating enzyme family protein [Candidatus Sumerlaeota bacterium]
MFNPGDIIERYSLISLLGAGGMGEVWLAEDTQSGQKVALKLPTDADYITQLRREGKLQLALDHPNIVKVYHLAIEHEPPFVVMEYVEGMNLRALMKEKGALPLGEAVRIIEQILNGLAAAHRRGVVHRDMKPENVLIGRDGQVKITDFGLGKVVQDLSISLLATGSMLSSGGGSIAGTYDYMSREQRAGQTIGPQADVYAVGLILFELLTGARAAGSLQRILQRRNVPESIIALILKAADVVERRFVDASDFLRALKIAHEQSASDASGIPASAAAVQLARTEIPSMGAEPISFPVSSSVTPRVSSSATSFASPSASSPSADSADGHAPKGWLAGATAAADIPEMESLDEARKKVRPAAGEVQLRSKTRKRKKRILAAAAIAGGCYLVYWVIALLNSGTSNKPAPFGGNAETAPNIARISPTTATAINNAPGIASSATMQISPQAAVQTSSTIAKIDAASAATSASQGGVLVSRLSAPVVLNAVRPTPALRIVSTTSFAADTAKPLKKAFLNLGRGVKMDLVWIMPGAFQMGSPPSEWGHDENESPQHRVTLDGFWMGETEVTQLQYIIVMGKNPSYYKGENQPVECVLWNDAVEFCKEVSLMTGKTVTLPTEAQWEYACRAGSSSRYYFGDSDTPLKEYAWLRGANQTHPVKTKRPNAWGLYDMHGNVWEWVADWYGPYTAASQTNPKGPATGTDRIMRGGHWNDTPFNCRSAKRLRYNGALIGNGNGFRVVAGADGFK